MLATYRKRLMHEHGLEVPLRCGRCGTDSVPNFDDWTPSHVINFGYKPTIYANLECPKCGESMKEIAGEKLVEMFADERALAKYKLLVPLFIAASVGVPALCLLLPTPWRMYLTILFFCCSRRRSTCSTGEFICLGSDAIVETLLISSWGCWAGAIATDVQIVGGYGD
jgi:hypothetical protein